MLFRSWTSSPNTPIETFLTLAKNFNKGRGTLLHEEYLYFIFHPKRSKLSKTLWLVPKIHLWRKKETKSNLFFESLKILPFSFFYTFPAPNKNKRVRRRRWMKICTLREDFFMKIRAWGENGEFIMISLVCLVKEKKEYKVSACFFGNTY